MEYVRLGKTGLRVSRFCLGCMTYGDPEWNGWAKDEEVSMDMLKKAYDAGFNFFDTANVYSNGRSEEILGKAIKKFKMDRGRIVVATKFGLSRKHILDSVEASLKRLDLEYIDLYQIHRLDRDTSIEEIMGALNDVIRSGKVRYIGASSMYAWEFQKANNIAEKNGWARFISMQNHYNLIYREEEREMIPYSLDAGIGGIPWAPLARGMLAARNRATQRSQCDRFQKVSLIRASEEEILDRVADVAEKRRVSPAQVALAWLLSKPFVSSPVVGIHKDEHLSDAIGALSLKLTQEECIYLEEPYVPKPLIPV
ncbi:hypothetical protein DFQ27_005416 [Actinomortierella ambigua]|uniref:NADP-dependent oxidoreductase domain-containing protein n=1 Tax=Actinomortierella ambigua TaxID=1343610 RepID=A0A9P6PYR2_9FUNG|nr:hypothetical protein DFQ27_005416 [Actinomortierella ambigua]